MKYLIQNRKEFAISIGFFVMTAINLIRAIMSKDISEDLIVASVYGFFGVLAWFYNMPTSEENCEATGEMRARKAERKGINGEYFYEDIDEEFYQNEDEEFEEVDNELENL